MKNIHAYFRDFFDFLFPPYCLSCSKRLIAEEKLICFDCYFNLPRSHFHKHPDNPVFRSFVGRVQLDAAAAWLKFEKDSAVQTLLHQLKYKGRWDLARRLGYLCAQEWSDSFFKDIDYMIPVPLHAKKMRKRGYNQALEIAKGIAELHTIPILSKVLWRSKHRRSQTRAGRFKRWEQIHESFQIRNTASLEGQHILLVDDVVTTGATLEACLQKLREIPSIRITVFCLAYA